MSNSDDDSLRTGSLGDRESTVDPKEMKSRGHPIQGDIIWTQVSVGPLVLTPLRPSHSSPFPLKSRKDVIIYVHETFILRLILTRETVTRFHYV